MPSNSALGVAFVKIVRPQLVVGAAIAHDVVRDFEDLMALRDDGLLVATMPFDAVVPRLERRPVAACGRQAGLDQGAAQIPVALTGLPAAPFAGTFVYPGHIAPQRHKCSAEGNRLMSPPVSATMLIAPIRSQKGITTYAFL